MSKAKPKLPTRQQELYLIAIQELTEQKGYSPSVREIAEKLGGRSPNAVHGMLLRLEHYGYIQKTDGAFRSIHMTPAGILACQTHDKHDNEATLHKMLKKGMPVKERNAIRWALWVIASWRKDL